MLKAKRPPQRIIDAPLPARPGGAEGGEDVGVEAEGGRNVCLFLWTKQTPQQKQNSSIHQTWPRAPHNFYLKLLFLLFFASK